MDYTTMTPREVRKLIREEKITGQTSGMCAGYAQANLVVLPKDLAYDFLLFTQRNQKSCPVLEVSDVRTLLDAVEMGYGSAVIMSVPASTKNIQYLSIEGAEVIEQMTELVYRADMTLSQPMKYLIRLITQKQGKENIT